MKSIEEKATEWVTKEYESENIGKWVFTQTDMEKAFKAGVKSVKQCKCGDKEKKIPLEFNNC